MSEQNRRKPGRLKDHFLDLMIRLPLCCLLELDLLSLSASCSASMRSEIIGMEQLKVMVSIIHVDVQKNCTFGV